MLNLRPPARVTVRAQGRGAGKTYAATKWALERALSAAGVSVAMIGSQNDRHEFLRQLVEAGASHGIAVEYRASRRTAYLENGSKIVFHDTNKPDQLRGPNYTYIVGENVGVWPEETYQNAKSACRGADSEREAMFFTFVGTSSERILDVLQTGFEATTN